MEPKRSPRGGGGGGPSSQPSLSPGKRGEAASSAKRPTAGLQEAVDRLAQDVQQLRIDFERFFAGALPFPPEDLRVRVQTQLRNLRNGSGGTAVDNFRLGEIEARFNSYNELFNRRLRDREEGRQRAGRPSVPPPPRYDPERGITVGSQLEPAAVEALYRGLAASAGAGPRFDLESFGAYLLRQAAAIRDKTGCDEVQFRLAPEEGRMKLKARPIGGRRGPR